MNGAGIVNPEPQTVVVRCKQDGHYWWMPLALCDLVVMPDRELRTAENEEKNPDWSLGTVVKDTGRIGRADGPSGGMIP